MRKSYTVAVAVAAVAAALSVAPAFADGGRGGDGGRGRGNDPLEVVGLTDDADGGQRLVALRTNNPHRSRGSADVVGLMGDVRLVGIDYRVQDGLLYGVGDGGGLYRLDPRTGTATKVGQLSVALNGTAFGVDFNPAANALRVISDTGQNLRQPFGNLDTATPLAPTVADGMLNGAATTGVTGAAYTNNDLDPTTATTLFDVATVQDQVVVQSPANSGTLAATGNLGVDAGTVAGFDVYSTVRDGKAVAQTGLAVLQVASVPGLYEVDLLTGAASGLGGFADGDFVTDLAIPLNQR